MSLSMHRLSIVAFTRAFRNLQVVLEKGEADAQTRGIDPQVFTQSRLAPDMFTLARQVQIATDVAKGCAARLAGIEVPSYADTESTFPELHQRIERTVAFLAGITPSHLAGSEDRRIQIKAGPRELSFVGIDYLTSFALPNVYFHTSVTYAILRHNGVPVGKMDYLGSFEQP